MTLHTPGGADPVSVALGYCRVGRLAEAEAILREVVRQQPARAAGPYYLGVIAAAGGRLEESVAWYGRAIELNPSVGAFYVSLADVELKLGRVEAAVGHYERGWALEPGNAEAALGLGVALSLTGRLAESAEWLRKGLELTPGTPEMWENLSRVLVQLGRHAEAVSAAERAIAAGPGRAEAYVSLGSALMHLSKLDESGAAFAKAIELEPGHRGALSNLGIVLARQGKVDEALLMMRRAADGSNEPWLYHNLGQSLMRAGRLKEAAEALGKVLEFWPKDLDARTHVYFCLRDTESAEEAVEFYRRACAAPANVAFHEALLFAGIQHPTMSPEAVFREHLEWDRLHAAPLRRPASLPYRNDRSATRRLRVGYVSPNFHEHSVMVFLESVLASHDRKDFEIHCYAGSNSEDETTRRLKAHADVWRVIAGVGDDRAAAMIEEDRIDILVDLALHLHDGRALLFARKPAPVQINWLAYAYSSGMGAMDYRITDRFADPPGMTERFNSEQLERLGGAHYCYRPADDAPDVGASPVLSRGQVTFGSMNNTLKISRRVVGVWAEVLRQVSGSRLALMVSRVREDTDRLLDWFAQGGVGADRIELLSQGTRREYLDSFNRFDVGLDPFPFTGHTTSCESLWMGVPFVTLAGAVGTARMGVSVLSHVGLEKYVARDEADYVHKAVQLASDHEELARLRRELRGMMRASPLMDAARVAAEVEGVYRRAWERWRGS